jgi:hypothetical protein
LGCFFNTALEENEDTWEGRAITRKYGNEREREMWWTHDMSEQLHRETVGKKTGAGEWRHLKEEERESITTNYETYVHNYLHVIYFSIREFTFS